jgi:hypothetical protein
MEIYKETEEYQLVKSRFVIGIECDVCHKRFEDEDWNDDPKNPCKFHRTELSHREGYRYESGGEATVTEVDICPDCIKDVFAYLKTKGANISVEKKDW